MRLLSIGRVLVTLVSLWGGFGSYIFDWNVSHLFNPNWPPHAKFHNAQTMLLGSALGLWAVWLLWFARAAASLRLHLAAVTASFYWLTQMGALLFPGTALIDPEFAQPGQPPVQLFVDLVMLTLLSIGYVLESRRLTRVGNDA